jgi:hypothetical protein
VESEAMIFILVFAFLISIILFAKKEKHTIIGLIIWLIAVLIWILNKYLYIKFLIIAFSTIWTVLVIVWLFIINIKKERG